MVASTKSITISIIIHENFSHIQSALHSILNYTCFSPIVYITINLGDESDINRLKHEFPNIKLITNPYPRGFAENHNHILRLAETDYVILLNDDIEAEPYTIDKIIQYMDTHEEVGLVSPYIVEPNGAPQLMVFGDPTLPRMLYKLSGLGYFTRHGSIIRTWIMRSPFKQCFKAASLHNYTATQFVPVVVGVAMCVRRTAYQQAGVMDEDTRVYGEEYGWHWRLRQHGWKITLFVETRVTHFNVAHPLNGWKLSEHRKGMLNYFIRYRSKKEALILRIAIVSIHTARALLSLFVDKQQAAAEWNTAKQAIVFKPKE